MFKSHPVLQAAILVIAMAGCGGNRAESGLAPDETATVQVENDDIRDMRIYVRPGAGGSRWRLGTATAMGTTSLKIPRTMVTGITELVFEIAPLGGGRSQFSQRITVNSGEQIVLRISGGP